MTKILVGQTIGRGYRFFFRRFFAVLGLSWLPALALGIVSYLWLLHFSADIALVAKGLSGARSYWLALDGLALVVAVAFFAATIAVPVSREALGLHDETVFAHFVVGRRELRLFFALLRFAVLIASAAVLLSLALGFALKLGLPLLAAKLGATEWHGIALRSFALSATAIVMIATLAFLTLRLGFFLMPIAAIEEKARVTRAWMLSSRNFWRLLVVTFVLALPVDLLARGAEYALFGREMQTLVPQAVATHNPALLVQLLTNHAAVFAAIGATVLTVLIALFSGAAAMAYRTRMPASDLQPVWQPAAHESTFEMPGLPAMAAPPLDVSMGEHQAEHQAFVAEEHATPMNVEGAPEPAPEPAMYDANAVNALPEAAAAAAAFSPAEHIAAESVAQDQIVAEQPAPADAVPSELPANPAPVSELEATLVHVAAAEPAAAAEPVVSLEPQIADHAPLHATAENPPVLELTSDDAEQPHALPSAEPAMHQASAEAEPAPLAAAPESDVVENILPTGDPAIAQAVKVEQNERELELMA